MNKLRAYCLISILISGNTFAINDYTDIPSVVPPSPSVAALFKANEIPVSLSTGIPQINLPIYTVQEGNIEVPIYISYTGGGIPCS